jgi:hypothetical protein
VDLAGDSEIRKAGVKILHLMRKIFGVKLRCNEWKFRKVP